MFPFFLLAFLFIFSFFFCVSFHFLFERFFTFRSKVAEDGLSRHRPTNQSFRVCKVNLATLKVATTSAHTRISKQTRVHVSSKTLKAATQRSHKSAVGRTHETRTFSTIHGASAKNHSSRCHMFHRTCVSWNCHADVDQSDARVFKTLIQNMGRPSPLNISERCTQLLVSRVEAGAH